MNELNDYAVRYVRSEIKAHEEILDETPYWKSTDFAFISFSITALMEILDRLENNKDISPITIIRDYIDQMKDYSTLSSEGNFRFLVACDMAIYVLDEIKAY